MCVFVHLWHLLLAAAFFLESITMMVEVKAVFTSHVMVVIHQGLSAFEWKASKTTLNLWYTVLLAVANDITG